MHIVWFPNLNLSDFVRSDRDGAQAFSSFITGHWLTHLFESVIPRGHLVPKIWNDFVRITFEARFTAMYCNAAPASGKGMLRLLNQKQLKFLYLNSSRCCFAGFFFKFKIISFHLIPRSWRSVTGKRTISRLKTRYREKILGPCRAGCVADASHVKFSFFKLYFLLIISSNLYNSWIFLHKYVSLWGSIKILAEKIILYMRKYFFKMTQYTIRTKKTIFLLDIL